MPGHEIYNCPALAFLITSQATGKKVLFDAGGRKDYWNYSPVVADRFSKGVNVRGLRVDKGVHEVPRDSERQHEQIEILSTKEGFGITDEWSGGSVGHPRFERSSAHRKALLEIMKSLIPDRTVQFNKRIVELKQSFSSKATMVFSDGEIVDADIVVGCDGIKGMSRRAVLGSRYPEEVPAKYNHTYIYRGIAPMSEARELIGHFAEDARWWMGKGVGWAM